MDRLRTSLALATFIAITASTRPLAADDATDVDPENPNRLVLHFCAVDGTPLRPLISDVALRHKLDRQGTPAVSADGSRVTFDAWTANDAFTWQESRIIVAEIDGSNAMDVSDGVMPSFSPDGKQLVVSRPPKYAKDEGAKQMSIWVMDADGKNKKMLADQGAWGGRWSPDGLSIVFHGGIDENGNAVPKSCLRLYDIATGKISNVFSPHESPFSDLSYHFAWNQGTGREVAFGGPLKDGTGSASATIDVDQGISSLRFLKPAAGSPRILDGLSFGWHPNGDAVLVTGLVAGRPFPVCVSVADGRIDYDFDGIPKNVIVRDPIYTPDGKHLIASFGSYINN